MAIRPYREPWITDERLASAGRISELVAGLGLIVSISYASLTGNVALAAGSGFLLVSLDLGMLRRSL